MSNPVLMKRGKKAPSAPARRLFNRLRSKIEVLQSKIKDAEQESEKAFQLFHSNLEPLKKKLVDVMTRFILIVRELTRDAKSLTKKERATLEMLLKDDFQTIILLEGFAGLTDEIKEAYQGIHGKSIESLFNEEMDNFQEALREEGIDIDLSNVHIEDDHRDIFKKFGEAMEKSWNEQNGSEESSAKPKTKKELLKEEKARQLEEWQNKGLGTIYKRLVKEFHPDLEQDSEIRKEKDLLMKKLTTSYDKRDLLALIELESEWLGHMEREEMLSEENLKVYNSLLKDQVSDLEMQLDMVSMHPRYFEMKIFLKDSSKSPSENIFAAIDEFEKQIVHYENRIEDVSGKNPIPLLKKRLAEISKAEEMTIDEEDLFELINLMNSLPEFDQKPPKKQKRKR